MIELNDQNFDKEIGESDKLVLVDFWAEWCPPCRVLGPVLEGLSKNFEDSLLFAKVNIDTAPLTSQKFRIEQVPTVVLFKNRKPVSGFVGLKPEPEIRKWVEDALKKDGKGKD